MRLLRCLAALGALSLPLLSQETGTDAAENAERPELRAIRPPAVRGPCSVPMPNPAKRTSFRFLRPGPRFGEPSPDRHDSELPMIPPPPGRFAFRDFRAPAPPCDERGLLQPLPFRGPDRGVRPDAETGPKPKTKPEPQEKR